MGIGIAVNASPLAFRSAPSDKELDPHHQDRKETDADKLDGIPLLPGGVAKQPQKQERHAPEPGVSRVSQYDCNITQCAWLFVP